MSERVKNFKEAIKFVIDLGEAVEIAMADKKFDMSELTLLIGPLMELGPAFEGLDKIDGNFSAEELNEIKTYIDKELDLANDKVEEVIEETVGVIANVFSYVRFLINAKK